MIVIAIANRWVSALVAGGLARTRRLGNIVKHRREVIRLRQLDARALQDIGLSRSEVEGALSGPLWADPSLRLCERQSDRMGLVRSHLMQAEGRQEAHAASRSTIACAPKPC